jgi:drug/metabolite transporter (DMT)-like permease
MARGIALVLLLALLWGTNWPILKVVLAEAPLLTFRALGPIIAGPILLAVAHARGESVALRRDYVPALLLTAFFNITCWFLLSAVAVTLMEAGRAAIIDYTMPIWALLPAWVVLGERPGARRLTGLALGVGALAALIGPGAAAVGAAPLGPLVMLLGAMSWAVGTVLVKLLKPPMSVLQFTGWQFLLGGVPMALAALAFEDPAELARLDWPILLLVAYVLVVPGTLGQWLWLKIVDILPVTVATLGALAVPVVGVLSSALALGERIYLTDALALALVLAALLLIALPARARTPLR